MGRRRGLRPAGPRLEEAAEPVSRAVEQQVGTPAPGRPSCGREARRSGPQVAWAGCWAPLCQSSRRSCSSSPPPRRTCSSPAPRAAGRPSRPGRPWRSWLGAKPRPLPRAESSALPQLSDCPSDRTHPPSLVPVTLLVLTELLTTTEMLSASQVGAFPLQVTETQTKPTYASCLMSLTRAGGHVSPGTKHSA